METSRASLTAGQSMKVTAQIKWSRIQDRSITRVLGTDQMPGDF